MAPQSHQKRKRASDGSDPSNRPSPHRPGSLELARDGGRPGSQQQQQQHGGHHAPPGSSQGPRGGGRRGARGGRGAAHKGPPRDGASEGTPDTRGMRQPPRQQPAPEAQERPAPSAAGDSNAATNPPAEVPAPSSSADVAMSEAPQPAPVPAPVATVAAAAEKPRPTHRAPPPFFYEWVTEEALKVWDESGRQSAVDTATQAVRDGNAVQLCSMYQELIRSGLDGRLDATKAGQTVGAIVQNCDKNPNIEVPELFVDTLALLADGDHPNPNLPTLVTATGISADLLRRYLDEPLLRWLGLVRPFYFQRMFVRKQTHLLYRQSNYNLLREECEGFSKLMTELFTISNVEQPSGTVVQDTFENVKALIGAFDLDAGRVLDVILDIFASVLVKQYKFFVKFLRASSYWPYDVLAGPLSANPDGSFGGLPPWAQKDFAGWTTSEEDQLKMESLKQVRDEAFWKRAREVGMNAFFELGARSALSEEAKEAALKGLTSDPNGDKRQLETRAWIEQTNTLPPPGSPVAAQLLGFKLRFYASNARDASDSLPPSLIYLAALLIKIGFISLRDLYPHLHPNDEGMETVKEKQMKEKEEKERAKRPGGGALNALARAGALADDTVPPAVSRLRDAETRSSTPAKSDPAGSKGTSTPAAKTDDEPATEQLPEPDEQKVQLLKSLLAIGAIPESLFILGRYTWLPDAFPDLPAHVHRILHHSLSKVYDGLCPLSERDSVRENAPVVADDQTGTDKSELRLTPPNFPKVLRWAKIDSNDADNGLGVDYRFYWDDWTDNVPVCQNVDDVFTLCNTFLNLSGVKIGLDTLLLSKLARIGRASLAQDGSESNFERWRNLCKRLLCPALSLTRSNPGIVNEVFELMKLFTTQTRYSIYAEWFQGATSRQTDINDAFTICRLAAKDMLKKLSKTNLRQDARAFAKLACASPGIVFEIALNQIESYPNLIDVVVEAARYFTFMGYDILTWAILSKLGREGRSRVTDTGFSASLWLQNMATFCGRVYKRYSLMNPLPLLYYTIAQLRRGNVIDVRILRELIKSMAGVISDTDFNDQQVIAMSGGELLQSSTLRQISDKRQDTKTSAKRLMKTLMDNNIAGPLLIVIAQLRQRAFETEEYTSNKVISELFDESTIALAQYHELLISNTSVQEFDERVPGIVSLISEYGLDPPIAFMIHRKSLSKAVADYNASHRDKAFSPPALPPSALSTLQGVSDSIDAIMSDAGEKMPTSQVNAGASTAPDGSELAVAEAEPPAEEDAETLLNDSSNAAMQVDAEPKAVWHPILDELVSDIRPFLSPDFEERLSVQFYVTFWQLSLCDITAPAMSYQDEQDRQRKKLRQLDADKSDTSAAGQRRKKQEKSAILQNMDQLNTEMKSLLRNYQSVRARLLQEKTHWFKDSAGNAERFYSALLQECFIPRALLSPLDSFYAQKMIFVLHGLGTPHFRTVKFLDTLLNKTMLENLIYKCTGREAENLGRFLNEVLKELSTWHESKETYENKAFGPKRTLKGFSKAFAEGSDTGQLFDYEEFRNLLYKWHTEFFNALRSCFRNYEYMHVKNATTVLNKTVNYFPKINFHAKMLMNDLDAAEKVNERAKTGAPENPLAREDVTVSVKAIKGNLTLHRKNWTIKQKFSTEEKEKVKKATSEAQHASQTDISEEVDAPIGDGSASDQDAKEQKSEPPPVTANAVVKQDVEDGEVTSPVVKEDKNKPANLPPKPVISAVPSKDETEKALRERARSEVKRRSSAGQNTAAKPRLPNKPGSQNQQKDESGSTTAQGQGNATKTSTPARTGTPTGRNNRSNASKRRRTSESDENQISSGDPDRPPSRKAARKSGSNDPKTDRSSGADLISDKATPSSGRLNAAAPPFEARESIRRPGSDGRDQPHPRDRTASQPRHRDASHTRDERNSGYDDPVHARQGEHRGPPGPEARQATGSSVSGAGAHAVNPERAQQMMQDNYGRNPGPRNHDNAQRSQSSQSHTPTAGDGHGSNIGHAPGRGQPGDTHHERPPLSTRSSYEQQQPPSRDYPQDVSGPRGGARMPPNPSQFGQDGRYEGQPTRPADGMRPPPMPRHMNNDRGERGGQAWGSQDHHRAYQSRQDPNYGRLNPPSPQTQRAPSRDGSEHGPAGGLPPTGHGFPAASGPRGPRRQTEQQSYPADSPSGPAQPSTSGQHPHADPARARNLDPHLPPRPPPLQTPTNDLPGRSPADPSSTSTTAPSGPSMRRGRSTNPGNNPQYSPNTYFGHGGSSPMMNRGGQVLNGSGAPSPRPNERQANDRRNLTRMQDQMSASAEPGGTNAVQPSPSEQGPSNPFASTDQGRSIRGRANVGHRGSDQLPQQQQQQQQQQPFSASSRGEAPSYPPSARQPAGRGPEPDRRNDYNEHGQSRAPSGPREQEQPTTRSRGPDLMGDRRPPSHAAAATDRESHAGGTSHRSGQEHSHERHDRDRARERDRAGYEREHGGRGDRTERGGSHREHDREREHRGEMYGHGQPHGPSSQAYGYPPDSRPGNRQRYAAPPPAATQHQLPAQGPNQNTSPGSGRKRDWSSSAAGTAPGPGGADMAERERERGPRGRDRNEPTRDGGPDAKRRRGR